MSRVWLVVCLVAWPAFGQATTLRYGVVVGTNVGADPAKGPLPDLRFAEQEARSLHAKLVANCSFGGEPTRTALLIRPSRAELVAAVGSITQQMQADRQLLGEIDTMFALFFTGHGVDGHILLADGPMSSAEVAQLLKSAAAKFTIGVFDACYSASLDPGSLLEKGVRPHRGVDLFKELPEEVLSAEGSMWLLSSGPDEASYEDSKIGGLFTHYFTEALDRAEGVGPGISLDQIWSYARAHTEAHARERNRSQNPRRIVSQMREQGAILFSFPSARDATLILSEDLVGSYWLSYAGGQLSERIEKPTIGRKAIAVYSGRARLTKVGAGQVSIGGDVVLSPGDELVVSNLSDVASAPLGRGSTSLWAKGEIGADTRAVLVTRRSLFVGLSGTASLCGRACLQPTWAGGASLRWDAEEWTAAVSLQFGHRSETFPAWGYDLDGGLLRLQAGYALQPLDELRVSLRFGTGFGAFRQRFFDDGERTTWLLRPELTANAAWSISDDIALEADVGLGLILAPSGAASGDLSMSPAILFGLGPLQRAM